VLAGGTVVGRIFKVQRHAGRLALHTPTHGYEPTREAAMAAFAKAAGVERLDFATAAHGPALSHGCTEALLYGISTDVLVELIISASGLGTGLGAEQ
jgi:hypothetical protein